MEIRPVNDAVAGEDMMRRIIQNQHNNRAEFEDNSESGTTRSPQQRSSENNQRSSATLC